MKKQPWKFFFGMILFISTNLFAQNNALQFPNACSSGKKIVIAAVGDLLFHYPLQFKAIHNGFDSLWQETLPILSQADMVYGNLEGPIAAGISANGEEVDPLSWKNYLSTKFPHFNYHPNLARDLKKTKFDIVSTANNHALDRGAIGIDRTIEVLDKAGIKHVGTVAKNSTLSSYVLLEKKGVKVAWIACAEHTNGIKDTYHQVLHCYAKEDKNYILNMIQSLRSKVDAIIVTPHWGNEYQSTPNAAQRQFAHEVLNKGAALVIGSHPHVLQPIEKYTTTDGRATLISYSLGNFVSYQGSAKNRSSIILLLGLTKTANNHTIINGVRFVPLFMDNRNGWDNIHLRILSKEQFTERAALFSHVISSENALFSLPVIINSVCN